MGQANYHCADNELHIWHVVLSDIWDTGLDWLSYLNDAEHERAIRQVLPERTQEVRWSRAVLRHVLSLYVGCDPKALVFELQGAGKPVLQGVDAPVSFSLSHSQDQWLLAVQGGTSGRCGVDIEMPDTLRNVHTLAKGQWPPERYHALLKEEKNEQIQLFNRWWVRYEAWVKCFAGSIMLASRLRSEHALWFPAFLQNQRLPAMGELHKDLIVDEPGYLHDLQLPENMTASVVSTRRGQTVVYQQLTEI